MARRDFIRHYLKSQVQYFTTNQSDKSLNARASAMQPMPGVCTRALRHPRDMREPHSPVYPRDDADVPHRTCMLGRTFRCRGSDLRRFHRGEPQDPPSACYSTSMLPRQPQATRGTELDLRNGEICLRSQSPRAWSRSETAIPSRSQVLFAYPAVERLPHTLLVAFPNDGFSGNDALTRPCRQGGSSAKSERLGLTITQSHTSIAFDTGDFASKVLACSLNPRERSLELADGRKGNRIGKSRLI
jgi:hypothetical protein